MCQKCEELWDKVQSTKNEFYEADKKYRKQAIELCDDKEEERQLQAKPEQVKEKKKEPEKKTVDKDFF